MALNYKKLAKVNDDGNEILLEGEAEDARHEVEKFAKALLAKKKAPSGNGKAVGREGTT